MNQVTTVNRLIIKAEQFIKECYAELGIPEDRQEERIREIWEEVEATGTYVHTSAELTHGARMAWRNSNRCIGRLLWHTLHVVDARHLRTADEAYGQLLDHIRFATNGGKIRSTITVFPPRKNGADPLRVLNHQLIRYAGYEAVDGVTGDPASLEFTGLCEKLDWQGEGTPFDVLPLVIREDGKEPELFGIPDDAVMEVPITHPDNEGLGELGLKWYAVPMISDMLLEIGGIEYPMAPFNGWYMGTEIGARNFADEGRYHLLPAVADVFGLDTSSSRSLWVDRALVELNIAVLHSYQQAGVTLVDHHTAAEQFRKFEENERKHGRPVTGNWSWLIPPLSPASTHIFHKPYNNEKLTPNYFYQDPPEL